jgi:mannitol 2-dehydrogenase
VTEPVRRLDAASLDSARDGVAVPGYDRDRTTVGIVHIGVGGFHRAHQAVYLDELMALGRAQDWAICGVGVMPADEQMRDVLREQDHLYTVAVRHPDGSLSTQVVGSMADYLFAPDDPEAVVRRMADLATRVVSLTITEGGYALDRVAAWKPGDPPTAFSLLTDALRLRRDAGEAAFTVMSCDNVEDNGAITQAALTAHARAVDPGLADWIDEHVRFPSSMVDRITPATTDDDRDEVAAQTGLRDEWPVVCEPFRQWVLEDHDSTGRPPWEDVGVQVVPDVRPYERMKLRLLNGGHQTIAHLGYLAGHRWVHEAAQDPALGALLAAYLEQEAVPSFTPPDGTDLLDYARTVRERFASPAIRDSLGRICAQTSDRLPKFVLPVVRDQLAAGGDVRLGALVVAAWARYAEGTDEQGETIDVVDPLREELTAAAAQQRDDPTAFLRVREVFGDLVDDDRFVTAYVAALEGLHTDGVRRTVERLLTATA